MPFSRYLTQKELEAAIEEIMMDGINDQSDGIDAVYIPPEVDTLTAEEDVNDDMNPLESEEPFDVVGTFELHVPDNTELPDQSFTLSTDEPEWDSSDDESLESKRRRMLSKNDRLASTVKWKKGTKNALSEKTPLEIFFMFMDDEVIDLILDFSIKYAQDNNRHEFSVSKNELLNFIGILLFSGYHTLPHIQHYWSTEEDKGINLVSQSVLDSNFGAFVHLMDTSFIQFHMVVLKITHSNLGPGGDVVMSLLSVVKKPVNHQIFFDNFFSSFKLFVHLKNNGYFATGTIRENRTNKCPTENCKSFAKRKRGSIFQHMNLNRKFNNSVVTVASNVYNVDPVQNVKRYDRKEAKNINIPQPHVIAQYNKYMGGVDSHDNGVANYRCQVFGKKWWWPLFSNSLDSLVVNAWKLYNLFNEKNISQLDFKSYMALRLLKTDNSYSKKPCTCHR
nr:unnamed protein product [Callosobruchus analis]